MVSSGIFLRRTSLAFSLVFASVLFSVGAGSADRGVGISTGEMSIQTLLEPGGSYTLPSFNVVNTGDLPGGYRVSIGYLADQSQRQPSADWFSFSPDRFALNPGESRDVVGRLIVPSGAPPGDYFALVKAQTITEMNGSTSVGVAAATKVSFTVESSGWLDAQRRELNRWLYDASPWLYILPAGLLLGFAAMKYGRMRFRLRSPFERR